MITNQYLRQMKRLSKTARNRSLKLLAWYMRVIEGKKVTHAFFYSQKQKDLADKLIPSICWSDGSSFPRFKVLFQGKEYSEMKDIRQGWCNWSDSRLVGLGTQEDVTIERINSTISDHDTNR